eukprot:250171-Pyramimonas_sp.AAC.1
MPFNFPAATCPICRATPCADGAARAWRREGGGGARWAEISSAAALLPLGATARRPPLGKVVLGHRLAPVALALCDLEIAAG